MQIASNSQYGEVGEQGEAEKRKPRQLKQQLGLKRELARAWISIKTESNHRLPLEHLAEPAIEKEPGSSLSAGIQFETLEHERKNVIPSLEEEIAQQGFQILKKGATSAQSLANSAVVLIHQV